MFSYFESFRFEGDKLHCFLSIKKFEIGRLQLMQDMTKQGMFCWVLCSVWDWLNSKQPLNLGGW